MLLCHIADDRLVGRDSSKSTLRYEKFRRYCTMVVCVHVKDFKKVHGLRIFRKIHAHFISCPSRETRKRKVKFFFRFIVLREQEISYDVLL